MNAQTTIIDGSNEQSTGQPLYVYYKYSNFQTIYLQSEINSAGDITELQWEWDGSRTYFIDNIKIYMGHTTKLIYSSTSDQVTDADLTLVYDGPFSTGKAITWTTVALNTPFAYNNSDNLVIYVDMEQAAWQGSSNKRFVSYEDPGTTNYRTLYQYDDNLNFDVASQCYNGCSSSDGRSDNPPSLKLTIVSTSIEFFPIPVANVTSPLKVTV